MSEEIEIFNDKLKELVDFGKKNKGVLEVKWVNDFFHELNLDVSQIDKIYEYLESNNIAVINLSGDDDEPDDDALLELEEDDNGEVLEEVSTISTAMTDDPVKLYLKEI